MVVFLLFIYVLAVLFIALPKKDYSSSEKRYLAKFPKTNFETITNGKFEKEYEDFVADHFPFRNTWIGINAYSNLLVGNNGNDGIYNCSDGYLINEPVSNDNRAEVNASVLADFAKSVKLPMTVMIAPSTGYIMDNVLPMNHRPYIDDKLYEQIVSTLGDSAQFVDIRAKFKSEAKNGTQLYYKTDHHWTTPGAYTAYTSLCDALGLTAADKSSFKVEKHSGFYGTTYSGSGFWFTPADSIELWKSDTDKHISLTITEGDKSEKYSSMYFKKHLKEDDKYPVFVDGNHAVETIVNRESDGERVLVLKDSFCHSIAPFLAENFRKITMVDMRYYKNSISEMVKKGNYDRVLVIYGIDNFATDTDLAWLS